MSESNQFRAEDRLSGRLSHLSPEEFVKLIEGLCQSVIDLEDPFYGGVNAANISLSAEGEVGLGEPLAEGSTRYTADQIEYLAPEVFWNDVRTEQADVYSIGILMYAWSNGGCLPYLYPDATATDRAEALRRRMSGEAFEKSPVSDTLNRIVTKAAAFKAEDRYQTVAELLEDFKEFAAEAETDSAAMAAKQDALKTKQAQEAAMMANILAAAQAAANGSVPASPVHTESKPKKARKAAPAPVEKPKKKASLRPLIAVLLIAAILMVAAVAMQFGKAGTGNGNDSVDTSVTPIVPTADPSASPDVTPTPSVTPETSPTVTPVPTPSYDLTKYSAYKANTSWNKAADSCINAGGSLVCISNKDEFEAVTYLADQYNLEAVWVGAFRKSGNIVWLDGSSCSYFPWAAGEPSVNGQHFIMLVKGSDGTWAYRDMADDGYTNYSGKIGYIMEK